MAFARMIVACGSACLIVALGGAGVSAQIAIGPGLRAGVPLRSMKDLRDQNLVKQRFDYSCGAAALATLLRYGFGEAVTERDILVQLFDLLSDAEKTSAQSIGFSLLHLQRVAQARGYRAQGFRLEPDQLARLGGPVIVFVEPRGYRHFAVLRGVQGGRVHLGDPSRGNLRMPVYSFLNEWLQDDRRGIIFAVEPNTGVSGRPTPLGLAGDTRVRPEIMTARELLAVGNPFARFPGLSRSR